MSLSDRRRVFSVLLAVATAAVFAPASAEATNLLIRNATLVSPHLTEPVPRAQVLIEAGRIISVTSGEPANTTDVPVIDADGLFLIPGLMDSHVHTFIVPGFAMGAEAASASHARLASDYFTQLPRSYLHQGVTQLVDLAATPSAIDSFNEHPVKPHILHCGAAPVENGYPTMFLQGVPIDEIFPYFVSSADDHTPEQVVSRMSEDGAVCLKLFFEDGFGDARHWPLMSDDNVRRAIAAAKANGMRVVVHANALDMQTKALAFDIDVIAHGLWNWSGHKRGAGVPAAIATHLDEVYARGIQFQPTFGVIAGLRDLFDPGFLDDDRLADITTEALRAWYATEEGGWFRQVLIEEEGLAAMDDEAIRNEFDGGLANNAQAVAYLAELGHPILLASDTPSAPTYGNQPGLNTYRELLLLRRAGLSLSEVLHAATLNNARAFGVEADYGSVEPGKVANLVLLNSNPLQMVEAYDDIRYVIVDGEVIERASLSARRP